MNVLLVPAHPGFPGQIPQSRKTVVCVCANFELVDKFCYLGDMLSLSMEMLMQLWRPEFKLDGINSVSWYRCLPIWIYH